MSKTYSVVTPIHPDLSEDGALKGLLVSEFDNRDDAIEYCMATFGTDNQGRINLIVEHSDEETEPEGGGGEVQYINDAVAQQKHRLGTDGDANLDFLFEEPTVRLGKPDRQEQAISHMYEMNRDKKIGDDYY